MPNLIWRLLVLCFVLLLQFALPLQSAWSEPTEKFTILSSIRPLTLLTSDLVAGLPVEVATLLPSNADPHNWALRISDRQALAAADMVLWLGPDFENFLVKPLRQRVGPQLELGALPNLHWPRVLDHDSHHASHHHEHTGRDMHLWLNPANVKEMQKVLAAKLAEQKPEWREELEKRLQQQSTRLDQMQTEIERRLSLHRTQSFIAYHDAYGHFADAFGLHQLAAVNQSSEQRLSAKALHQLQIHARTASCLMAEKNGEHEQRLAKMLGLQMYVADGLAGDQKLQTFTDFLTGIAAAFEACTSTASD